MLSASAYQRFNSGEVHEGCLRLSPVAGSSPETGNPRFQARNAVFRRLSPVSPVSPVDPVKLFYRDEVVKGMVEKGYRKSLLHFTGDNRRHRRHACF